jgi:peptidoglycan/xylan/chitin deacetylase (PgdA/CDA1 family)
MCSSALLVGALLALPGVAAAGPRPTGTGAAPAAARPLRAGLAQHGRELVLSLRTSSPLPLADLEPQPQTRSAAARYACLELSPAKGSGARRLCLGGPKARRRLGLQQLGGDGKVTGQETVAATVKRPQPEKLVASFVPSDAGLAPQRYHWRILASGGCQPGGGCAEALPASGELSFRLRPVRAVGCTPGSGLVSSGPTDRKVVALTFDDGPSEYTPEFLKVLREKGVPGTFFEIGQEMQGREATMRQILAEGDEIGDHTMNHVEYPDYAQIAGAAQRIQAYTHFKPCLFRPPGGAVNASVIATAASLGLFTVNWNVDPRDWSLPGTSAIYNTIVNTTQPGSIILMHDGGGNRSETLAALPQVIDTLRARGYAFTTVSQLLGGSIFYKPYG